MNLSAPFIHRPIGTWLLTLGLMLANVPVVYLGHALMKKIPAKAVRLAACALFCILGAATLLGSGIALS